MLVEAWRGLAFVAHVAHQDRVAPRLDRSRDGAAPLVQEVQRLPLAVDPDRALDLTAEPALLRERRADPTFLDELAVSVDRLVTEVPPIERVVDLQRRERLTREPRVGAAQVDARFLAVFQRSDDLLDEPFAKEVLDHVVVQRSAPLTGTWTCRMPRPVQSDDRRSGTAVRRTRRDAA